MTDQPTCDWGQDCGPVITNLDGDNLCQKHADAWCRGEAESLLDEQEGSEE